MFDAFDLSRRGIPPHCRWRTAGNLTGHAINLTTEARFVKKEYQPTAREGKKIALRP